MPSLLPVDDDLLLDEDESGIGSDRGRSSDGGSLGAGSGSNFLLLSQRHIAYIVRLSRGIDSASVVDGRGRMAAARAATIASEARVQRDFLVHR